MSRLHTMRRPFIGPEPRRLQPPLSEPTSYWSKSDIQHPDLLTLHVIKVDGRYKNLLRRHQWLGDTVKDPDMFSKGNRALVI